MRRVLYRTVVVLLPVVQIAADIPAGDADVPRQRDHDVREVLAHSLASHSASSIGESTCVLFCT